MTSAASDAVRRHDGRSDVDRAVAELAERLPTPLTPLARLAYNYFWAWGGGGGVFRELDAAQWRRSGCNPRHAIETTPPRRFAELARDDGYLARLRSIEAALDAALARPSCSPALSAEHPVAYVCSEFGLHCSLPLYGGGLGVLAGDFVKAASDVALPVVGVGLMYRQGYFRQRIDATGWQQEYWTDTPFERLPAVLVTGADRRPIVVEVPMRGRCVRIQIWRIDAGRVPVFLLDTDRDDNHPVDRWITARLYIGDRHTRLAQYGVLGIGGMRALAALGIHPALVHLNEGHGGFSIFERCRQAVAAGAAHDAALAAIRASTVFTTHTPVAAGNEWYAPAEVELVMREYVDELPMSRATFYDFGRLHPGAPDESVCITVLALRGSRVANGVSQKHGDVARQMWQPLWPERGAAGVPIRAVTNGVHTFTWMAEPMQALLDRHLGPEWRTAVDRPDVYAKLDAIPDEALWAVRSALRRALIDHARTAIYRMRLGRGESPAYVDASGRMFHPDALTIGFARRVATYKRLHLLTNLGDRGFRLLRDTDRPIQLVIAGKAHPQDDQAKHALRQVFAIRSASGVAERVAFLEDYDLHQAPHIVAGVDLWLNLPRPPQEASGTSGMKVAVNGGLNLSVLDGWWPEAFDGSNGWGLPAEDGDPAQQDARDAERLVTLLERDVVPTFYDRGADGMPHGWIARMRRSLQTIIPRFSAARMVRDYEALYRTEAR